jgi:hypothetical protein
MASTDIDNLEQSLAFSLTEGGPGFALMKRLHLLHPKLGSGSARTALILMALTWLALAILCLVNGRAFSGVTVPFFYDLAAYGRFMIGVPVLVLADIPVGARLRQVVKHFLEAHLIREEQMKDFGAILSDALRLRDSRVAELTIFVLVYLSTYNALAGVHFEQDSSWFRPLPGQGLTGVGYWYAFVALPIFQFLFFRWIYRMALWSRILWRISKLDLLLTPTHPDVSGGLAFLGKGLVPFGLILFALSAVVAGGIANRILYSGGTLGEFQSSYAALFVIALVVFAGPVLVFVPDLMALKLRGLMEYGALGSEYTQAFHQRWIRRSDMAGEPLLGSADIQSLADLGNSFEIIRKMRVLPIAITDFIAMVLPGLLPVLPLLTTVMPLGEILKSLMKLIV